MVRVSNLVLPRGDEVRVTESEPTTITMRTAEAAAGRAAEPDVLLATKLDVPQRRPGLLPRPRLLGRLAAGMEQELTLVCAPAGFGKTSLLGDWARHARQPVAWLSLDAGDDDPVRFWRYVAAALDRAGIAVGERLAPLLRGPEPASLETVVTALINELVARSEEVTLLLDDYQLIQVPPIHDSLTLLLDRAPPMLRLVLASRADPPLPLARLRARGQLAELRERDLRFTMEESAALLRETSGLELPASSLDAVATRTEGWVAGLQLAALSLHGHPDPAGFVATFSGSDRYVLDYLAEEVLDRQPEPLRLFLLDTSVLERLSGPLCDAVTGRTDSQRLLEQAERANLFLVPLDGQRRWWRYHRLFADLLRARLRQTQPERVGGLHQAAAAWCERNGLVDDAIRHALAAGDQVWAARLIERHFDALLRRAEGATVDRWVAALPAELVRARPRLLVAQAVWALLGGRVEEAEPLVDQAETALESSGDEPYEPDTPTSRRLAGRRAGSPTCRRRSRWSAQSSHGGAGTPRGSPRPPSGPWPTSPTMTGRCACRSTGSWRWPTGSAAGWRRPRLPLPAWSQGSGRPVRATWPCAPPVTSVRCSAPAAAWPPRWAPTSGRWRSPAMPAVRCRPPAWRRLAWPRC
jgi:LuxR family maltose regulon positive regulatory protein